MRIRVLPWPNHLDEFSSRKGPGYDRVRVHHDHRPAARPRADQYALIFRIQRAMAVRRAIAVREIQEQAHAFDDEDRKKILTALDGAS
jgi:hypothetical protein